MDILNWLYLVKNKLARTTVENPSKDLIALGADATFNKRGDKYQTYTVPLADAVHDACTENSTLRTGIYDQNNYPIGFPVMLKTCTRVVDTPASPTFVAVNLQGWSIQGSVEINSNDYAGSIYLGTIEFPDDWFWPVVPWKSSGMVYTNGNEVYSTLGNGAMMFDNNANTIVPVNVYFQLDYYSNGADLYMIYDANNVSSELYDTVVSFQFEFLHNEALEPTFTYYD